MKKTGIFILFLLAACAVQASRVDDFEGYATGSIGDVASPPWVTTETTFHGAIGADGGNTYITVWGSSDYRDISRPLAPDAEPISTLSTLFLRIYFANDLNLDYAMGLTQGEAGVSGGDGTGAEWYGDYGPYFRIRSNGTNNDGLVELSVRNGGSFVDGLANLNVGQWYHIWMVVDPAANNHDLYYAAAGQAPILARADNGFRFAYANPLRTFLLMTAGGSTAENVRVDDIYVIEGEYLDNPLKGLPHDPVVTQGTPVGTLIPTTLQWVPAADPAGVYAVNPDIVDEYLFMGTDLDPNLRYVGATGSDPGTEAVVSEYSLSRALDRTYYWAIVEAMDGFAHNGTDKPVLSVGALISQVDPNNIVGPTWSYESTRSLPVLTGQPVDARAFATDPSVSFTVTFNSPANAVTATWYKNDAALTGTEPDVTIDTDPHASSMLTIATPALSDEGKYYCVLSVEEGTEDDIQTATRLLIIKKTLAAFEFDQSLDDSSGNGAPSGAVKSVAGLTEPNSLAAPAVTPTYVPGIEGDAVYLSGTEFIDLGVDGYPKAGPLDTIGDARGDGYEKTGFGRGMEQGTILCWVRPESTGAVYMNANAADSTHFGLTVPGTNSGRFIMRGWNWDESYQEIGTAAGGLQMTGFSLQDTQWHLLAATWQDSTVRVYINGEQVASNSAGTPEIYRPWELANVVGASRPSSNRVLLTDFLTGAVDRLRVYNYALSAGEIAGEYELLSGNTPCANHAFAGNEYNFDNTASSYCKVDLSDFAVLAANWLSSGLFTEQ